MQTGRTKGYRFDVFNVALARCSSVCTFSVTLILIAISCLQLFDESLALLAVWACASPPPSPPASSPTSPHMSPYGLFFAPKQLSLPFPSAILVSYTNDDTSTGACFMSRLQVAPSCTFRHPGPACCHCHTRHSKHATRYGQSAGRDVQATQPAPCVSLLQQLFPTGNASLPHGVSLDIQGRIYVACAPRAAIRQLPPTARRLFFIF